MPSAAANALTRRHRSELAVVGRAVVRPVRQVAATAQTADVDSWLESVLGRLLQIVRAGWLVSRGQGDRYLREHARAEGRAVVPEPAIWVPDRVIASARVTGPVEFKRHLSETGSEVAAKRTMTNTLAASMQRQALAGQRDTVAATSLSSREIVGWRRVVDADPCFWCAMLAGRGAVYLTRESAGAVGAGGRTRGTRQAGESFHDGDECTVEPLYEDEDEPDEVLALQEQWRQATAGTSGAESIRAWRRHWDARNQDNPQPAG